MNNPQANAATNSRRVCIVQQVLPHYRVPVFDLLGRQPGISLTVSCAAEGMGSLETVAGTDHFEVRHRPIRRIGPFLYQSSMREMATSGEFDVVIFTWNRRILGLGATLRAARRRGVRTVLWGHGYSKNESWWRSTARNMLARHADALLLYNHSAAANLIRKGFDPKRVFVGLNAIDQQPIQAARTHWSEAPEALRAFQREHGLDGSVAVFISRMEADKHVPLLLESWTHVITRRPSARLVLVGKGAELERLKAMANSLGLGNHVVFTGPIYDDKDLAPWCMSASCFVYPRAIGLSIFHAFGYGLPVVTSDDLPSHNPEIEAFREGENGLMYRDGNAGDFAAKILRCFEDDSLRKKLAEGALETVLGPDGFNIERMVRGFVNAIRGNS